MKGLFFVPIIVLKFGSMETLTNEPLMGHKHKYLGPLWVDYLVVWLLPIVCFAFWEVYLDPQWQSGANTFIGLLIGPTWSWYFWPCLLYASISMTLAGLELTNLAYGAIRWGLVTGILLGIHFNVLMSLSLFYNTSFFWGIGLATTYLLSYGLYYLVTKLPKMFLWLVLGYLVVGSLVVVGGYFFGGMTSFGSLFAPLLFFPILGPGLFTLSFLRVTKEVWAFHYPKKPLVMWALGWTGLYGASWYLTWLEATRYYANLPVEPPDDCYVASAAAHGHQKWVRHRIRIAINGVPFIMNKQLQVLKAAELGLRAFSPDLHGFIRKRYNKVGPYLVRHWVSRSKWQADLAYTLLKPLEWVAILSIGLVFPQIPVSNMYATNFPNDEPSISG